MTGPIGPIGRDPRSGGVTERRAASRARHPTARSWSPDRARVLARLADRAQARGAPWPRVAAAVLLLRGVAGDEPAAFAARAGLSPGALARLERGLDPPEAVPALLRTVPGLVDWVWVEETPPGPSP
ncbi:MAG TPA: hypothetical protein VFY82_07630 [Acidimicrobiales bacterium]|nr:hypothetical protein [Acidimicrobiales bacterium]